METHAVALKACVKLSPLTRFSGCPGAQTTPVILTMWGILMPDSAAFFAPCQIEVHCKHLLVGCCFFFFFFNLIHSRNGMEEPQSAMC